MLINIEDIYKDFKQFKKKDWEEVDRDMQKIIREKEYKEIDELINSDKYKPLKLYRKHANIYTNYDGEYDNCVDVLSPEESDNFVCSFTEKTFEFGLIDYCIICNDCYGWEEELESRETIFHNEFLSKKDMKLFLEFELDLLNILNDSKPMISKDIDVFKLDFDTDIVTDEKYAVYYKDKLFMQYYLDNWGDNHKWYFSLLSCADINWESWEDFSTFYDDYDDYYDDSCWEEEAEAGIWEYKSVELNIAKNIVYTLLHIIKNSH